jgi:polysaccharide export outer membrane protein
MRLLSVVLLLVLNVQTLTSAQTLPQESPARQALNEASNQPVYAPDDYIIRPGDVLSVRVLREPDMSGDMQVSAKGHIRIPFLRDPIMAAGRTAWQLADVIRQQVDEILWEPQVDVQVKQGQQDFAYLLGEVNHPGPVPVRIGTRLLNVLVAAGGLSKNAGNIAYILRDQMRLDDAQKNADNANNDVEIKLTSVLETVDIRGLLRGRVELASLERFNRPIYPGDVISVPEADRVFIGGNVNTPGAFELRGDLTLSQALMLAGGLKPDSRKKEIRLVRPGPDSASISESLVNLDSIEKDATKDIRLQPNDIVFVPVSRTKTVISAMLSAFILQSAVGIPAYLMFRR